MQAARRPETGIDREGAEVSGARRGLCRVDEEGAVRCSGGRHCRLSISDCPLGLVEARRRRGQFRVMTSLPSLLKTNPLLWYRRAIARAITRMGYPSHENTAELLE